MNRDPNALSMRVQGMTCQGCVEAVRRVIHRLDPQAEIALDLTAGSLRLTKQARSLDVTQALGKAGYTATDISG